MVRKRTKDSRVTYLQKECGVPKADAEDYCQPPLEFLTDVRFRILFWTLTSGTVSAECEACIRGHPETGYHTKGGALHARRL